MLKIIILLVFSIIITNARKHHLEVKNDVRPYISLSSFGFYKQAHLIVKLSDFKLANGSEHEIFGLSLDKTISDAIHQNIELYRDRCLLDEYHSMWTTNEPALFFVMNFINEKVNVKCSQNWRMNTFEEFRQELQDERMSYNGSSECNINPLKLTKTKAHDDTYEFSFVMHVNTDDDEGFYNLYFHSCPNYNSDPSKAYLLNFNVYIEENNDGNYLSVTEMQLPVLFFVMSVIYLISGLFWVYVLRGSKHPVCKIHILMGVLVFLKFFSLTFHSITFHYIETRGEQVEAWAVIYYITHLLKGVCLAITIVLISTGWTIIKHKLSNQDKTILVIVILLQIVANIAEINLDESEQGSLEHSKWRDIFILVDLLCCAVITIWSIKLLKEASSVDKRASSSLKTLKLFRQFFIMIVCYIYLTRIIVFLIKITVPFKDAWLSVLFRELTTYLFFIVTAYKFRPNNLILTPPYTTFDN